MESDLIQPAVELKEVRKTYRTGPIEVRALPLYMRDLPATAAIARAALDLALELA